MKDKICSAIRWNLVTELLLKIMAPVINMTLARILLPEDFGVVAILVMIASFSDLFANAGVSKYVIYKRVCSDEENRKLLNVAFTINASLASIIFILIFFSSNLISFFFKIPNACDAIRVYSSIILIDAYFGIAVAYLKKIYRFKEYGYIRLLGRCVHIIITIPLAVWLKSYWALVIGNLLSEIVSVIGLVFYSKVFLNFRFDVNETREMLPFCFGSMVEILSSWLVFNIGVFFVGKFYGSYYAGIYSTSINTVNQIISIINSTALSVLISILSEYQGDKGKFLGQINMFQRNVGLFSIPLGVGIFLFREFLTNILLGPTWKDAELLIGLWGFVLCESIIFADFAGCAIVAKGKPILLGYSNFIQTILLGIAFYFIKNSGFETVVIVCCLIRLQLTCTHYLFAVNLLGKWFGVQRELLVFIFGAALMGCGFYVLDMNTDNDFFVSILNIVVCIFIYFISILIFPSGRKCIVNLLRNLFNQKL